MKTTVKTIILANRPDLVSKLEKYGLLPITRQEGKYVGCAKQWAKEGKPPYHTPEAQALAERLPTGWEEITFDELDEILRKIEESISDKKKSNIDSINQSNQVGLRNLTQVTFLGISLIASLLSEVGMGNLPKQEENDKRLTRDLTFDVVLHFLNGSNLLSILFEEIACTMDTTEENQKQMANSLTLVALLLTIFTASKGDEERLRTLMKEFKPKITEGFKMAESFITDHLRKNKLSGKLTDGLTLYLRQGQIALDKDDFSGLYEAFNGALGLIEVTPDLLLQDLRQVKKLAIQLRTAFTTGMDEETTKLTSISQAL